MPQSEAQKRASKKWEDKQKTIGCKLKREIADELEVLIFEKGYKSFSEYIKDLIRRDSGLDI